MATDRPFSPAWQVFLAVLMITALAHVILVGLVDGWLPVPLLVSPLWIDP